MEEEPGPSSADPKSIAFPVDEEYFGLEQVHRRQRFEEALRNRMRQIMTTVRFGAAHELFDPACWKLPEDEDEKINLVEGKKPSEGITALLAYKEQLEGYEGLETAKLDCAESIEVCRWMAEMDVTGPESFDVKYSAREFSLSAPGSSGIRQKTLGVRVGGVSDGEYCSAGGVVTGRFLAGPNGDKRVIQLDEALPTLPIGSRVMWRNFDAQVPMDDDFKNENTMKISDTEYAAHPLGEATLSDMPTMVGANGHESMLSSLAEAEAHPAEEGAAELRDYYAGVNSPQDYINKFIRIVEFETFEPPFTD